MAQSSGMISLHPDVYWYDWKPISGGRFVGVSSNSVWDQTFFTLFDASYHEMWSLGFEGEANFGEIPLFAELGDGSFVVVNDDWMYDDSVEVVKVSAAGQLLLRKRFHFAGNKMRIRKVVAAPAGDDGFVLGGNWQYQSGFHTVQRNYLLKCDDTAAVAWSYTYGDTGSASAFESDLVVDSMGYTVLSNAQFGSAYDACLFHVDLQGVCDRGKRLQQPFGDYSLSKILPRSDGSYVLLGQGSNPRYYPTITFVAPQLASAVVRKYPLGTWPFEPAGLEITAQGHLDLVGIWGNSGTGAMFAAFQLDAVGELIWGYSSLVRSGRYYATPRAIAAKPDGSVAIVVEAPGAGPNSYLIELDEAGTGLCLHDTFPIMPSAPIVMGIVDHLFVSDPIAVSSTAITAATIATPTFAIQSYCGHVGIEHGNSPSHHIAIYPNPSHGDLALQCSKPMTKATIRMYNSAGTLVQTATAVQGTTWQADATHLPSGIYLVEVVEGQSRWVGKWVRE